MILPIIALLLGILVGYLAGELHGRRLGEDLGFQAGYRRRETLTRLEAEARYLNIQPEPPPRPLEVVVIPPVEEHS